MFNGLTIWMPIAYNWLMSIAPERSGGEKSSINIVDILATEDGFKDSLFMALMESIVERQFSSVVALRERIDNMTPFKLGEFAQSDAQTVLEEPTDRFKAYIDRKNDDARMGSIFIARLP
jgi:hypothetical protein